MKLEVMDDADSAAQTAADFIAAEARNAIAARGRFVLAVSGGRTPLKMLHALSYEEILWEGVDVLQVDERVAPEGDPDRNWTSLREALLRCVPLHPKQIHAMPVERNDLEEAAAEYARLLEDMAGSPAVLDCVHLGLGADGHTASLVPGDPVLDVQSADVATAGIYQGRRRMTLTYPVINRSRRILWLVTGSEKREALSRLLRGDAGIPAGRVNRDSAVIFADRDAGAFEIRD